jgi:hypothetical protein
MWCCYWCTDVTITSVLLFIAVMDALLLKICHGCTFVMDVVVMYDTVQRIVLLLWMYCNCGITAAMDARYMYGGYGCTVSVDVMFCVDVLL